MRTLRSTAALLAGADSLDALTPLITALGVKSPIDTLDAATRDALGIPAACQEVGIGRGTGAIRVLLLRAPEPLALRETVRRIAARLAATAPHILWLLVAADHDCTRIAVATWSSDRRPPRIAALIIERARVMDSDAETISALAAAQGELDTLTHARWLDVLGREAITRRFYRALERTVGNLASSLPPHVPVDDRTELALLCTSRLIFLSFLEAKRWLDGDRGFLARTFDDCAAAGGHYHRRVLLPLLHGTLNTRRSARSPRARAFGRVPFLNGGLFARTPVERRHRTALFPDDQLGALFGDLLSRYRFTAREDSATWSEAAIDPEMLGKSFESIMASRERRSSGAYYTPQPLVERVTSAALTHGLRSAGFPEAALGALIDDSATPVAPNPTLRERLARLRVIDPACGSGAFLVHALERISAIHATLGDPRDIVEIRRSVLTRTIFGVDRNPFAVWLCELRLWLSMVIESTSEDPCSVPPLPNLDHHIRVGDALAGEGLAPLTAIVPSTPLSPRAPGGAMIGRMRERYVRATGPRKRSLARDLDRAERARATALIDSALEANRARRRDLLAAVRSPDLFGDRRSAAASHARSLLALKSSARDLRASRRAIAAGALPFSFAAHFADAATEGGFDVVVGNPPWVRLHRIPRETRIALRARFAVFHDRGWERGANAAHASAGFASQVDLAALFVERSLELLRPGGAFSLLLPSKLWQSLAGGALRRLIAAHATPVEIEDLHESPHAFDAAVYPSILTALRRIDETPSRSTTNPASDRIGHGCSPGCTPSDAHSTSQCTDARDLVATVTRRGTRIRWELQHAQLNFDRDSASPWLILPPDVRRAFDRVTTAGTPLADSAFGRPHLGVKCGCNGAFIVTARSEGASAPALFADVPLDHDTIDIEAPGRRARVERHLLRPLIRGESLRPWHVDADRGAERILWPHDDIGTVLPSLPPLARHWLMPWRRRLIARTDGGGRGHWWTLFRTESARNDVARVVWADLGRSPRAAVLPPGDHAVALNSCYVVRCPTIVDAHALAALLNGPLATAWLNALAEPARGGFRRYLGWTTALLPLPHNWPRARLILSPLGERGRAGEAVSSPELLAAALAAFELDEADAAALLEWTAS